MALLTELGIHVGSPFYRHGAPLGLYISLLKELGIHVGSPFYRHLAPNGAI
ncbi:MAG: hypothetical protein WD577_07365 [Bacteroidales bacterium]